MNEQEEIQQLKQELHKLRHDVYFLKQLLEQVRHEFYAISKR